MKGEILFEKMTGISEEYITEAALVPAVGASPAQKPEGRFAALSRVLNSGWGVACICFIVAIAAVVGMVAWGRMGEPFSPGSDPSARFTFSYEMTANDGSAWSGTAYPGDLLNVDTTVVNQGKAFDTYDFFAYARFVLQEDESVVIEGHYPLVDTDRHTVEAGGTGSRAFHFHIPENATPGVYDLVLSCDGVQQVFGGALTVGDPTGEAKPPIDANGQYTLSFGYEPFLSGSASPGTRLFLETWVRNQGAPFTFEGSSMGFAPKATLVHMESGYRIEGAFDVTTDFVEVRVNTGDTGRVSQEFLIPADAPTGAYSLVLSFGGITQTFEKVLTVADPTVPVPGVLYNLTMPQGSDWLYEPIYDAYIDGETVTVRIKFATDVGTLFFLNGDVIAPTAGDDQLGYWEYSFIMPQKDSLILFHTYDGTAPYHKMLEACICSNPYAFREDLFYYYGEFGDGVMVALQLGYGEAIWSTAVGGYTFVTPNTHDMMAFYNGSLYELEAAYNMGLLTDEDLEAMLTTHRKWFPYD